MKTKQVEITKQSFFGFVSAGTPFAGWQVLVDGKLVGSYADLREAEFVARQFAGAEKSNA